MHSKSKVVWATVTCFCLQYCKKFCTVSCLKDPTRVYMWLMYSWSSYALCVLHTVTCVIMQKNGAGLHTASSCFWDNSTDGKNHLYKWSCPHHGSKYPKLQVYMLSSSSSFSVGCDKKKARVLSTIYSFWPTGSCTIRWENKTMYCIVTVFGLAIWWLSCSSKQLIC